MNTHLCCLTCQALYVVPLEDGDEAAREAEQEAIAAELRRLGCDECGAHRFEDPMTDLDVAAELFARFVTESRYWMTPIEGAVTPDLSEFFRRCDPKVPGAVHWARWLRIEHGFRDTKDRFNEELAEGFLEAAIAHWIREEDVARMMRLAFHKGFGEYDPDQLTLFEGNEA